MEYYFLFLVATIALVSAFKVITAKNTVKSAFALILTFFCTAIIWLSLKAEFLAISLILVYVGAVLVLFLFVVMMLEEQTPKYSIPSRLYPTIVSILFFIVVSGAYAAFSSSGMNMSMIDYPATNNIKILGKILFDAYLFEFEIVGLVLLVGIVASISLTHKGKVRRKTQSVDEQVATKSSDRLQMLKLDGSEKLIRDK